MGKGVPLHVWVEELFHATQPEVVAGLVSKSPELRLKIELEAKTYLLRTAEQWGFNLFDIAAIKASARSYGIYL